MLDLTKSIKLSEYAVLRKEHFGGLLFSKKDKSIMELNHFSYELLAMADKSVTGYQLIDRARSMDISDDEVLSLLKKLSEMELICNG